MYMLQDKSPDHEETWKFLKKQLDDAAAVYSCIQQSEQASQLTKELSLATFTTVCKSFSVVIRTNFSTYATFAFTIQ